MSDPTDHKTASKAAAAAVIAATSEEVLVDAFDRVDNAIDAWHLNTVDEVDENDSDDFDDDGAPAELDGTFLTGIGLEEQRRGRRRHSEEVVVSEPPPQQPAEPERPSWEDVEDPTERLALALGLDPRQLSVFTGKLTSDRCADVP